MPAIADTLDRSNEPLNFRKFRNGHIQKFRVLVVNENEDFRGLIYIYDEIFFPGHFFEIFSNFWQNLRVKST